MIDGLMMGLINLLCELKSCKELKDLLVIAALGCGITEPTFISGPAMKEYDEADARLQQIVQHKVGQMQKLHFAIDLNSFGQRFYSRFSSNLPVPVSAVSLFV